MGGGTKSHGLIRMMDLLGASAGEALLDHRPHPGDTIGTSNKHHLVHVLLVEAAAAQALFAGAHGVAEVAHGQLLGTCQDKEQ